MYAKVATYHGNTSGKTHEDQALSKSTLIWQERPGERKLFEP